MAIVSVKKISYKGWKNCIEITNGIVDLIATTDVGPRIIRYGFCGKENEFCEVPDQVGTTGGDSWKIYGGHRLWHSPEKEGRTYEIDNSRVEWKKRKNGVIIRYNVDPRTQIKKEIEITLMPDSTKVTILHRLTNKGPWQVELAAWSLSVMAAGGREVVPQISGGDKLLPNRMLSLWSYTKLNDKRVHWGEKYVMLDQIPGKETDSPFKIGLPVADGWAAYSNHGHLFVKKFPFYEGVKYPDYSASSYETYTNHFMLEMESLSPLVLLENEESVEHTEEWFLYENVNRPETENDINQTILPLIK